MYSMHNPCAVIPVYNHETAIGTVVDALLAQGLPCILVDDASEPSCATVLDALAERDNVHLVRLTANQGKGGAVMTGLREASRLGYSHALQVDADGQQRFARCRALRRRIPRSSGGDDLRLSAV